MGRKLIEITKDAHAALSRLAERTHLSKKDILSLAVVKLERWDGITQSLVFETAPVEALASDAFWKEAEAVLIAGIRRCRDKHIKTPANG